MKLTRSDIRRLLENDGFQTIEDGKPAKLPISEQRLRAMEHACELGFVDIASELRELGVDIASNSELLRIAADSHQLEIVEFLISNGANVNGRSEQFGQPPIMDAAGSGAIDIFNLLVRHGADISATCEDGTSALDWARNGKNTIEHMEWVESEQIIKNYDTIIETILANPT